MAAPTITTGILTGGSNSHQTTSEEVNAVATDFVSEGIVGTFTNTAGVAPATGAFAVNASGSPDTNINISTGVAYVTVTPTSQNSQSLRVKCSVTGTLTISSNASGSTKYDWIYISVSAANAANPNTAADNVATIVASRSSSASTDDGTPPTYGYPIAVVTVANGFSTITNSNIRDIRINAPISSGATSSTNGWQDLGVNPNTVTYNGNRSYSLVFNSTDLTATLAASMRLRTTRLAPAPTQCTSLNGTNQYWSKSAPAGMTFTDDFVVSAWVRLTSYGAAASIASRYNGTSGWSFELDPTGRLALVGFNASASNFSYVISTQSVPLNKWVHVTAQLDMSTAGVSTTTSYVMIDGVDAPCQKVTGGTNPTALIQAGSLEVGSRNAGTQPFPGKIAQVAIFSAKVTEATMQTYISQSLSGSETSSISVFKFSGDGNDSNANANNLTAQNSATATNSDGPFGSQGNGSVSTTLDYGIIAKASFSTNTTLVVQVPEGCTIPVSGGISAVSYSTHEEPYLFPKSADKWRINSLLRNTTATTSNASYGAFAAGGYSLNIPIGAWTVGQRGCYANGTTTTVYFNISPTALTGLTAAQGNNVSPFTVTTKSAAAAFATWTACVSQPQVLAAATSYVMYTLGATTSANIDADATNEIFAEFNLL